MGEAGTGAGQCISDVGPGIDMTATARFDHGQGGGVGGAALFVACAETQSTGDDGDAQGSLGLVIGGREHGVGYEGDDGVPVVEYLPCERPDFLSFMVAVELACAFEPGLHRVEDGVALVLGHAVDQSPQLSNQPLAKLDPIWRKPPRKGQPFADEVGDASLTLLVVPIGTVAVGDQPADNGVTEQVADFLVAATADVEDGGGLGQNHPQPAESATLVPGRLVGMDQASGPHLFEQVFSDRLAGDADLADAAVYRTDRQRHAHPRQEKLVDFPARLVMARVQSGDKSGQRWSNHAALGQVQLPLAPVQERQDADGGACLGFMAAGAGYHLIAVLDAGDPDATRRAFQFQHREGGAGSHLTVPQLQRLPATGTDGRPDVLRALRLQRLATPLALRPRLFAWLAPGRLSNLPGRSRQRGIPASTDNRASRTPSAKRRVRRRRARAVGRVHCQALGLFNSHPMKTASQLDELIMVQRLKDGAVHVGEIKRTLDFHVPRESQHRRFANRKIPWASRPSQSVAPAETGGVRLPFLCGILRLPACCTCKLSVININSGVVMMINHPYILIVDDCDISAALIESALKDMFATHRVCDGRAALDYINANHIPTILILDITMPGMSGIEVCKEIKDSQITKDIPVIFVTSSADANSEALGLDLGAVDYIIKPFRFSVFQSRIRRYLNIINTKSSKDKSVSDWTEGLVLTNNLLIRALHDLTKIHDLESAALAKAELAANWFADQLRQSLEAAALVLKEQTARDLADHVRQTLEAAALSAAKLASSDLTDQLRQSLEAAAMVLEKQTAKDLADQVRQTFETAALVKAELAANELADQLRQALEASAVMLNNQKVKDIADEVKTTLQAAALTAAKLASSHLTDQLRQSLEATSLVLREQTAKDLADQVRHTLEAAALAKAELAANDLSWLLSQAIDTASLVANKQMAKDIAELASRSIEVAEMTVSEHAAKAIADKINFISFVTDNVPASISYWNNEQRCLFANRTSHEWHSKTDGQIVGLTTQDLLGDKLSREIEPFIRSAIEGTRQNFERAMFRPDGTVRQTLFHFIPDISPDDVVQGYVEVIFDMTETKLMNAELEKAANVLRELAQTDPLTGLSNRRMLDKTIEAEFQRYKRFGSTTAVLMIDIDHFKRVNDTWGHMAGDRALVALAHTIQTTLRATDLATRYGGEEFVVLLVATGADGATAMAERIRYAVTQIAVPVASGEFGFTISIGVASFNDKDKDWSEVISRADHRLYLAKECGRNKVVADDGSTGGPEHAQSVQKGHPG